MDANSNSESLVPTWVFDDKGGSVLMQLPAGAPPPEGYAFSPPSGVELKVKEIAPSLSPLSPPMPITDPGVAALAERITKMEDTLNGVCEFLEKLPAPLDERVQKLEEQMAEVDEFLNAMTAPPAEADDKSALLARAKELGIEGFDGRSKIDKIKAAIAEAEAKASKA